MLRPPPLPRPPFCSGRGWRRSQEKTGLGRSRTTCRRARHRRRPSHSPSRGARVPRRSSLTTCAGATCGCASATRQCSYRRRRRSAALRGSPRPASRRSSREATCASSPSLQRPRRPRSRTLGQAATARGQRAPSPATRGRTQRRPTRRPSPRSASRWRIGREAGGDSLSKSRPPPLACLPVQTAIEVILAAGHPGNPVIGLVQVWRHWEGGLLGGGWAARGGRESLGAGRVAR